MNCLEIECDEECLKGYACEYKDTRPNFVENKAKDLSPDFFANVRKAPGVQKETHNAILLTDKQLALIVKALLVSDEVLYYTKEQKQLLKNTLDVLDPHHTVNVIG